MTRPWTSLPRVVLRFPADIKKCSPSLIFYNGPASHPPYFLFSGHLGLLPWGSSGRDMNVTTPLQLAPGLRKRRALSRLLSCAFMMCTQTTNVTPSCDMRLSLFFFQFFCINLALLRRAYPSSRGVLPSMVCLSVNAISR